MKNAKILFIIGCICFANFNTISAETLGEKAENTYDYAADKTKGAYYDSKAEAKKAYHETSDKVEGTYNDLSDRAKAKYYEKKVEAKDAYLEATEK